MQSIKEPAHLAGHTNVASRALRKTVRAATAEILGVPLEMVSATLKEDESPLYVDVATAVPASFVKPGTNLVAHLCEVRAQLQPRLSQLLGARVGTLNLSVGSIYHPHNFAQTPGKRARVE